jgi:hypothetical protein
MYYPVWSHYVNLVEDIHPYMARQMREFFNCFGAIKTTFFSTGGEHLKAKEKL